MKKRILLILLTVALLLSTSSCAFFLVVDLIDQITGDLNGELEWVELEGYDEKVLAYREDTYYYTTNGWLQAEINEDAILLGWQDNFFFESFEFYAYDDDNPLYIIDGARENIESYDVLMRTDYDWKSKPFLIEDTDGEVILFQELTKRESDDAESRGTLNLTLYLKDDPRVYFSRTIYWTGSEWYLYYDEAYWYLSEDFVALLRTNDILPN